METLGIIYMVLSLSLSLSLRVCVCIDSYMNMYLFIKIRLLSLDSEGLPIGKLEMRQRLLIALAAAKGSCTV